MSAEENFRTKIESIRKITQNAVKILKNHKASVFVPEPPSRKSSFGSEQEFELEDEDETSAPVSAPVPAPVAAPVPVNAPAHELESWISEKAKNMEKNGETKAVKELQADELPKDSNDAFTGFERMVSSGNQNDCLIHSLLTSLSPTFRTLKKADKDSLASTFRRELFLDLLNKAKENPPYRFTKEQMAEMISEAKSTGFLSDLHLRYLANQYTFNVFFYELGAPRTDPWHLLMPYEGSETAPLILLYNPGRGHFEAVRDPKDNYIFELALLKPFRSTSVSTNQAAVNKEKGLQRCPFIVWDVIKKKGTEDLFVVVDQEEQDGKCTHQYATKYNSDRRSIKQIMNKPRDHKDKRIDIFPTKDQYELATPAARHYDTYKAKGGKQTRKNKLKK